MCPSRVYIVFVCVEPLSINPCTYGIPGVHELYLVQRGQCPCASAFWFSILFLRRNGTLPAPLCLKVNPTLACSLVQVFCPAWLVFSIFPLLSLQRLAQRPWGRKPQETSLAPCEVKVSPLSSYPKFVCLLSCCCDIVLHL